jgi:Ricin-type beta-trefoil lectin domain
MFRHVKLRLSRKSVLPLAAAFSLAAIAAGAAPAASAAPAKPAEPGVNLISCALGAAALGYFYITASGNQNLAWTASGGQGKPLQLEPKNVNAANDCFKLHDGGSGGGYDELQLYNTNLCANVAGNSNASGAWIVLWPCDPPTNNEEFAPGHAPGTAVDTVQLQAKNSSLCLDLAKGWNDGSVIVQKPCENSDPWQAWFT